MFRFEEQSGRLFLRGLPSLDSSDPYSKALCNQCWPRWLMWKARLGLDIHMHAAASVCGKNCMARGLGRRAQIAALESLYDEGGEQAFWIQKSMDGLPGVNGSTELAGARVFHFAVQRHDCGQRLYEFASGLPEFIRQMQLQGGLHELHLPLHTTDSFGLVFEVFKSAHTATGGVIQLPTPGESSLGMHAVFVTGYRDGGETIRFANSWGASWGDRGFGYVSRHYLERYFHQALTTRPARWGPHIDKKALWQKSGDRRSLRQAWLVRNPVWRVPVRSSYGNWRASLYETVSPEYGCPVECLDIRNGYGLRLGWAFVYHRTSDYGGRNESEIRELFCWPTFRRMGVGTLLERLAARRATAYHSDTISLFMNEADAIVGPPRTAARLFGRACGYEWRWRTSTGPRLAAVGIKRLT